MRFRMAKLNPELQTFADDGLRLCRAGEWNKGLSVLASVIGALTPVVVLAINFAWHRRGERLSPYTIAGVLLGFAGLGFIFNHGWADFLNPDY